jgi:hypothetical protein
MVEYGFGLSSGHASVAVLLQDTFGHHREARDITVIEYVKAFVKAMQADKFGGPEQLKLVDAGEPEPATGQVRIRVPERWRQSGGFGATVRTVSRSRTALHTRDRCIR